MSQLAWNPKRLIPPATSFHSKHSSWTVRVISFFCPHPKHLLVKYEFAIITACITGGLSHRSWPLYNANISKTLRISVRFCLSGPSLLSLEIEIDKQSIILCFRAASGHLWGPEFIFFVSPRHTTIVFIHLSSSVCIYVCIFMYINIYITKNPTVCIRIHAYSLWFWVKKGFSPKSRAGGGISEHFNARARNGGRIIGLSCPVTVACCSFPGLPAICQGSSFVPWHLNMLKSWGLG